MPRGSRTGVRGLRLVRGRYVFELRYRDASTGAYERYRETFPPRISASAAKERALQISGSLLSGRWATQQATRTVRLEELLRRYLEWVETNGPRTYATKQSLANVLREHLGDPTLAEVVDQLEGYKMRRTAQRTAPGTINRSLIMLRHMMRLGIDWQLTTQEEHARVKRVALLKEPPGRVRYLTEQEKPALLLALPQCVRPIVEAAFLSGMRRGELIGLQKSAVDFTQRTVTLERTKSNRVRRVPINDALERVLSAAMAKSNSDYVFVTRTGKPYTGAAVSRAFARTVKRLGLRNLRLHDMRHDFATSVRRDGADLDTIRELLGQSTGVMAQRYAHVGRKELHEAVARLTSPSCSEPSQVVTDENASPGTSDAGDK